NRPGEEKRDFEVEQNEQDGDEVVTHVEFHARVFESLEAAFVRGEFFRVRPIGSQCPAQSQQQGAESQADQNEQENGDVFRKHALSFLGAAAPCGAHALLISETAARTGFHQSRSAARLPTLNLQLPTSTGADGETRTLTALATTPSR